MGKSHDLATIATDGLPTLEVDTIKNTSGTTGLTIDSSGRVNAPALPRIDVSHSSNNNISYSVNEQYLNASTVVNNITPVGITFDGSNGRFTLPVAGDYYVSYFNMAYGGSGAVAWVIRLNGTGKFRTYIIMNGNYWHSYSCSGIVAATAGQYINVETEEVGATSDGHGGTYSGFSIYKIG